MPVTVKLKELSELDLPDLSDGSPITTTFSAELPLFVNSLNMTFSATLTTVFLEKEIITNLDATLTPIPLETDVVFGNVQHNKQLNRIEFVDRAVNIEDFTVRTVPSAFDNPYGQNLLLNVEVENKGIKTSRDISLTKINRATPIFTGMTGSILPSEISLWQILSRLKQPGKNSNRFETSTPGAGYGSSNPLTIVGNYDPNSWAYSLNTTGVPVGSNLFNPTYSQANLGCLIAPRIGIGVGHWTGNSAGGTINTLNDHGVSDTNNTVGNTVVFKDKNNQTYTRTIIASFNYNYKTYLTPNHVFSLSNPDFELFGNLTAGASDVMDITIYLLDSAPPSSITPVKLLGMNFFNSNKLFFGGGVHLNQYNQIQPLLLTSFDMNGVLIKDAFNKQAEWANASNAKIGKSFGEYVQNQSSENVLNAYRPWRYTTLPYNPAYLNTENTLLTPQAQFIGSLFDRADIYPAAARIATGSGDSGTPYLYVGDGGEVALALIGGGISPFAESNYPWIVAQIDALRSQVGDTGPFTYPQIMTPPTDASVVDR